MIDRSFAKIVFPPAGANVNQSGVIDNAVATMVAALGRNGIGNLDDNFNVIVVVFIDPSISVPIDQTATGPSQKVLGKNSFTEWPEPILVEKKVYASLGEYFLGIQQNG